jgi:hypothetical protein
MAPATAVPCALLSADLRTLYTDAGGISIFLLVSIRLGDRCLGTAGNRLSQAEDLIFRWAGRVISMLPCRPSGEDATRRQHTGALHEGRFCAAGCRAKLLN